MSACCCCSVSDFILYIIAFFFPPIAVLFRSGCCSQDLLLNVLLTLLAYIPGLIHAWYYITITSPTRHEESRYFYQRGWADSERLAGNGRGSAPSTSSQHPEPAGYGSINNMLVRGQPSTGGEDNKNSASPPPYSELP